MRGEKTRLLQFHSGLHLFIIAPDPFYTDLICPSVLIAHLAADVPIGEPHDNAVLGRVVLILILNDQALPSKVVSLPLCQKQSIIYIGQYIKLRVHLVRVKHHYSCVKLCTVSMK